MREKKKWVKEGKYKDRNGSQYMTYVPKIKVYRKSSRANARASQLVILLKQLTMNGLD
jgi:hypothetical protein